MRMPPFLTIATLVLLNADAAVQEQEHAKGLVLDLGKNLSLKLVKIPAGKFKMGVPGKQRCQDPFFLKV